MTERPSRGPARILHDLVHRPRQFRQFFGVACCVLVTWLGHPVEWLFPFGAAVAVLGALTRLWGSGYVRKNDELATTGPYRFVRHPLYTGNLLIAIGFAAACGLWWSPLLFIGMWLYAYPSTIRYEDQKLEGLFGDAWREWSAVTPAVIPSLRPKRPHEPATWSFKLSLMRHAEPLIAVGLVGLLVWLQRSV